MALRGAVLVGERVQLVHQALCVDLSTISLFDGGECEQFDGRQVAEDTRCTHQVLQRWRLHHQARGAAPRAPRDIFPRMMLVW